VLHTTRAAVVAAGADARRQLKALIVTAPEPLRDRLRGRPSREQVGACVALVARPSDPVEHRATVRALALTAQGPGRPGMTPSSWRGNYTSSSWPWPRPC